MYLETCLKMSQQLQAKLPKERFFGYLSWSTFCILLPSLSPHKWVKDLGTEYVRDDRQVAIVLIKSTFICKRLRETQCQILHSVVLHKINCSRSPLHIKCCSYCHCFWEYKLISRFRSSISEELVEIIMPVIVKLMAVANWLT